MSTTTPNLGLEKPAGNERPDIDVINGNMDILDEAVGDLQESVSQTITTGLVVHKLANWCIVILSGYTVTSSGSEAAGNIGFNVPRSVNYSVAVEGVGPGWLNIRTNGSMTLYNESMGGYLTGTVHGSAVIPLK